MPSHPPDPDARVELVPATLEQAPILANLLELYAHDFSEFHPIELGADGRFGYKRLSSYWSERGRHPFLAKVDGRLAGLVLVSTGSEIAGSKTTESEIAGSKTVWDMAEFFVVRRYRRRRVGTELARQVWRRFPGPWEVRVKESNQAARLFWQRAISEFVGAPVVPVRVEKSGELWDVFSFVAAGG